MGNNFKKIRLKKLREPGNKYFNQGIDIALTELAGDEKTTVHLLKFDKNLNKKIKDIIKDGVANILFQPYVGKRRRPDVVLVSRGNKYYELEMRFGDAISETNLVELLKNTFQTKDNLKTSIQKFKETIAEDSVTKAMQRIKEESDFYKSLTREALKIPKKPDKLPGKPKDIQNKDGSVTTFEKIWYSHIKKWVWEPVKVRTLPDGSKSKFYKNKIATDGKADDGKRDFLEWTFDNEIDMWDMWKHYKKNKSNKKRYKPRNWADLIMVLNSLNFEPIEVLNAAIDKTQTKTQFLEHRLYRNIRNRNLYSLRGFVDVIRLHKDKGLQQQFHSIELQKWQEDNKIFFGSEEQFRVHRNALIEEFNNLFPSEAVTLRTRGNR